LIEQNQLVTIMKIDGFWICSNKPLTLADHNFADH
jgi:hypothetical protein